MITLKTLPQATEQEVFDQVASHLLKQGEKSANRNGGCRYRYEDKKCAAGCLIGDDEYYSSLEAEPWSILSSRKKVPCEHADLIGRLQTIHDAKDAENWELELKRLALVRNLNWNL